MTIDDSDPAGRREPHLDAATAAEIEAIVDDPLLPPLERHARLQAIADRLGEAAGDDVQYAPLQLQLERAFALLAEGGHDYSGAAGAEAEAEADAEALLPTPNR
ncbi:hypothetical protein [Mangrovibrevibacter kandeliae]|uniref:hypothetical protein n=1 Tax=Mangrovibrevibacter kandeliae TaxID=2968473 RepID=UPI0021181773|nr:MULTISPECIES: hypothetical protein [unclassified Aurantimonas]MCQ8780951.1 hypothetical protein [Aurantimonas sp. CSK15Z-1]MCW4113732.1 hypothetical protein [Aurantimonas sp. MSK8Z-1]